MVIPHFMPYEGQHCETTATGTLLKHLGIDFSEPMLFGIGEGLGYIYWNMKIMDFPFIGGRIKPDVLTANIVQNLGLQMQVNETTSRKKAWNHVRESIDNGIPIGLKLDSYYLEYFTSKIHFAGHYVAMYGYDEAMAYLVDTVQQGGAVQTSLASLEQARNARGPMSSRNRSYTIRKSSQSFELPSVLRVAILNNAREYLNPPIRNIGYKGIEKTATEIKKWFKRSRNIAHEFGTTAKLMEHGGTGGAIFRNLYRDFLFESARALSSEEIASVAQQFDTIAKRWTQVAGLFAQTAHTEDGGYIDQASAILLELSVQEKTAMENLLNAVEKG
jgi:hypothetical protein